MAPVLLALTSALLGVEPWPKPIPPYYIAETFTQQVDHFNAESHATYAERYLVNATWWRGPPWPIVFYCGAEGNGIDSVFSHSGWVIEMARELGALMVFAEMRYFGRSAPFGDTESFEPRADRLGLLSIEQTLADYAALVRGVKRAYHAESSRVLAVGGSLAGTLAFFLRLKYPSAVDAALAASAPVLGYVGLCDPYGWYRVATATFDKQAPGCSARVRRGFGAMLGAPLAELTSAFRLCAPAGAGAAPHLADVLSAKLATMAEAAYPLRRSPVVEACRRIGEGVGALAPLVLPPDGSCLPLRYSEPRAPPTLAAPRPQRAGVRRPAADGWGYLACSEVLHPISANNVTDMFPPREWRADDVSRFCLKQYNATARFRWLPESMGMADGVGALGRLTSRVVFSNGLLDPWSAQSVTRNVSETIVAINIPDGSHHSDLGSTPNPWPEAGDSESMRAARQQELALMREWLLPSA